MGAFLLAGTRDGLHVFLSDNTRASWMPRARVLTGQDVSALAIDTRNGGAFFAGSENGVFRSNNANSWEPSSVGLSAARVWTLQPAPDSAPGVVYAGCEPAGLFRSDDGGRTWKENEPLAQLRQSEKWEGGFGGLCLHSIVCDAQDPQRTLVGISAAGVRATIDGGKSWSLSMSGMLDLPDNPTDAQKQQVSARYCIHKLSAPLCKCGRIYQKNHYGVFRSEDRGAQWTEISEGLPWVGGFPLVAHPNERDTVFVIPAIPDTPHILGALRVFRSRDAGKTWTAQSDGLPQDGDHRMYRECLSADTATPCGVYFGTKEGNLYASNDEGDHWQTVATGLPPIRAVRGAVIG